VSESLDPAAPEQQAELAKRLVGTSYRACATKYLRKEIGKREFKWRLKQQALLHVIEYLRAAEQNGREESPPQA
jgi:hypothetical protein